MYQLTLLKYNLCSYLLKVKVNLGFLQSRIISLPFVVLIEDFRQTLMHHREALKQLVKL